MASIELAAPRQIAIEDRGKTFILTIGRIPQKAWLKYFEGIISTSENQGGKRVDRFDASSARLDLVEQYLTYAKPYAVPGGAEITSVDGWQKMLPLAHRLAAADALVSVERGTIPDDVPLMLGVETVYLNAIWSAGDGGSMQKFSGLVHRFKTPTAEQHHRFSRESSRSIVVGGTRRGVTRWLGAQAALIDLYDDLIQSVDGYTVSGRDLGEDRDAIVREMDAFHKVAAADVLFSPAAPAISEEK